MSRLKALTSSMMFRFRTSSQQKHEITGAGRVSCRKNSKQATFSTLILRFSPLRSESSLVAYCKIHIFIVYRPTLYYINMHSSTFWQGRPPTSPLNTRRQPQLGCPPSFPHIPCIPFIPFPFSLPLLLFPLVPSLFSPLPFLLSLPLPFALSLPLEAGPLESSCEVWGSAVSIPSGVWGEAPTETELGGF